jgi:O-antigen/teichoic acid export membrane protein
MSTRSAETTITPIAEVTPITIQKSDGPRISHAALLTAGQLSRGLLRLLFLIAAARGLGPAEFGVYSLLLATVEMIAVASGTGYADFLTREAAKNEGLGWSLGFQLTWLRFAYTLIFVGLGLALLLLLGYSRAVLLATAALSLTLLPRAVSEGVQGVLRGVGRYLESLLIELSFGLTLVVGAGFVLVRGGLRSAITTEIAAASVATLVAIGFAVRLRPKQRHWIETSTLLKTSAIFNIYAFVGNLYDRLDILILSKLAGDYATGVYGAAYRPIATLQLLPYGLLYSLLPSLARTGCAEQERARLEKAMGLLLSASYILVLCTVTFADNVVPRILGSPFHESAAALKILIWAVILRFLNYALNVALLAKGRERVFVITSLACLAANVVGNLALVPRFSWRAAAGLTILTELVLLIQNMHWLRRALGTVPKPFGWARTSAVFTVLFVTIAIGTSWFSPAILGFVCLVLFLAYLHRAGMLGEFAAAWRAQRSVVG